MSEAANTAMDPRWLLAQRLVPSQGSTAKSTPGPFPLPTSSPMYNIGASSRSPSPITIFPFISILPIRNLIASTAAASASSF